MKPTKPTLATAIRHIDRHGILLVYPIKGREHIPSLWKCYYPRSEMRWEWSEDGDDRVATLWHLREELSRSRRVVYGKWLHDRATFFSRSVFTALLSQLTNIPNLSKNLDDDALSIMQLLEEDSPLSPKIIRSELSLEGKLNEARFNRALRELWSRLLIVGFGEVDEGGFPSLAIGATKLIFEDLWEEASGSGNDWQKVLTEKVSKSAAFALNYRRFMKRIGPGGASSNL